MNPIDFGDLFDLRIRLDVLAQEADRRLVTVFGSGISNAVLPGVPELTELFREHVPRAGRARFDATLDGLPDPGLKYQNAAAILTKQAGEPRVMRAIRTAVLRACVKVPAEDVAKVAQDEDQCRALVRDLDAWTIPRGYEQFAQFFASLPGRMRGPVITTNFDPLIEIALTKAGVSAVPIPVPTDSAPTPDQLREATTHPVLHIHGYWTGPATSNVPSRITADRPQLDSVLQQLLTNSVVLVVGYSGWLDGFMKSLRTRVLNEADLLQAEVLWAAYESNATDAIGDGVLGQLVGAPGFTLYLGVDGHELFGGDLAADDTAAQEEAPRSAIRESPAGSPTPRTRPPPSRTGVGRTGRTRSRADGRCCPPHALWRRSWSSVWTVVVAVASSRSVRSARASRWPYVRWPWPWLPPGRSGRCCGASPARHPSLKPGSRRCAAHRNAP